MSKKVGHIVVLEETLPASCQRCGKIAELRPYGQEGMWICFQCGMENESTAVVEFEKLFNGSRDI